jgi:ABC-type nickel/cobalt efflux system permease component RcnA
VTSRSTAWRIAALVGLLALACVAGEAVAQGLGTPARNPFSVGVSEGGGQYTGLLGWIMARQMEFERQMSGAVRAIRTTGAGFWTLAGISFAYGVFHAAGPGHGKAVVAAYMIANERALKRGLVISGLASLLQGFVAIAIVGVLALLLNATAQRMRDAAQWVEMASFAGIASFGAFLAWRKGRALLTALRPPAPPPSPSSRFVCEVVDADESHVHGPDCGHFHMPDPRTLGKPSFSWRDAALTVVTAGSRPCSGAILVLVFSMAQGIFWAGVAATFAMALGTAITTGALATMAVLAKDLALRLTGGQSSRRGEIVGRALEFAAACLVLALGLALLLGFTLAGI